MVLSMIPEYTVHSEYLRTRTMAVVSRGDNPHSQRCISWIFEPGANGASTRLFVNSVTHAALLACDAPEQATS
jgi:hypothetical protein